MPKNKKTNRKKSTKNKSLDPLKLRLLVIVVAVIGVAFFILVSNFLASKQKIETELNTESYNSCIAIYKDEDLCKYIGSNVKNLNSKIRSANSSSSIELITEADTPEKMRINYVKGDYELNAVVTDDTFYIKNPGSDIWRYIESEQINNLLESYDLGKFNFAEELPEGISFNRQGDEKCGELNCFKYKISEQNNPDVSLEVWFDKEYYALRRLKTVQGSDIFVYYGDFKISEPTNVREADDATYLDMYSLSNGLSEYFKEF